MSKKILVVDDEKDLVRLYQIVLDMAGYNVTATTSSTEALSLVTDEEPDLVLLDVMMPELDGIEVCRRIRAMQGEGLKNPVILMYTANDSSENRQMSEEAGADSLISKQVPIDKLTETINSYFSSESIAS